MSGAGKTVALSPLLDPAFFGMSAAAKVVAPHLSLAVEKITDLKAKLVPKWEDPAMAKNWSVLFAVAGLAVVFHGNHFARVVLCVQAVMLFGSFDKVTSSIKDVRSNITTALEKEGADAPAEAAAPAADKEDDSKNKHAAKREAKAAASKAAPTSESKKEDITRARKLVQAMDTSKVHDAGLGLLSLLLVCTVVGQSGLAFSLVVATTLSAGVMTLTAPVFAYEAYEGDLLRIALFFVFMLLSMVVPSLTLAMNHSVVGASLVLRNATSMLKGMGKEALLEGEKSLYVEGALVVLGSLWQVWSVAAGSGVAWYLQYTIYVLPCIAEAILCML